MQIHELPDVTAIGSGGYFATDNGSQTTKIDYDALAKAIIEQYSASTLAGSAQSVKAALDGLDGNKLDLKAGTAITNGTNVNTLQTPGTYFCASASTAASLSNIPTQATSVGWRLDVARNGYNTDNYLTQTITGVSSGVSFEYVRGMSTKGTWGGWLKAPTRAEVDALNSMWSPKDFTSQITWLNGAVSNGLCKFLKVGNIVFVYLDFNAPSEGVGKDTNAFQIPAGYRQNGRISCILSRAWNKNETAIINISGEYGAMSLGAWEASKRYVGTCAYIIQ